MEGRLDADDTQLVLLFGSFLTCIEVQVVKDLTTLQCSFDKQINFHQFIVMLLFLARGARGDAGLCD